MQVELNENGTLTVTAESPLEVYALRHWADSYFGKFPTENPDGPTLLINASVPGKGCTFKDPRPEPVRFTPGPVQFVD